MPTLAEEYSTLGDVDSRLTDYVVRKLIVPGLSWNFACISCSNSSRTTLPMSGGRLDTNIWVEYPPVF